MATRMTKKASKIRSQWMTLTRLHFRVFTFIDFASYNTIILYSPIGNQEAFLDILEVTHFTP